ncbi:MAG: NifB/NifX family molybdenum-iron cluster-binding protein [Methanobacteriaceae archaeon]|nr:NifB/NifX family molybdenum-iron cluster-binding protein [Methanobacteriaceae archaeon]MDP2835837.1 NifB/NifX family molybdenum-iron cluster-binding protein [Methanobacteriaceae archaeon]MDP3034640.1 NifB/NifX family molybdenum-iron cluster-binding protein [Methanobacteriaceae archaeon]
MSPIFRRIHDFISFTLDDCEINNMIANENPVRSENGAGSLASNYLADNKVDVLITGKLGNVSFHVLRNAGIKVYKSIPGTVEKNIEMFKEDKLMEITTLKMVFQNNSSNLKNFKFKNLH